MRLPRKVFEVKALVALSPSPKEYQIICDDPTPQKSALGPGKPEAKGDLFLSGQPYFL
jgi:hypothetical protein